MRDPKSSWATGGLSIDEGVLARVDEEARAAYGRDEESCGFLLGPVGDPLAVDGILPMENRANKLHALDPASYPRTGRMYFDIDALAFAKKVRSQAELGHPVKVLYHSHLDVGAYFSATDAAAATMGGDEPPYDLAYLVTSVRGGGGGASTERPHVDDRKLFVWDATTRVFVESSFVTSTSRKT
jgi:proteasome lid subunit RPN8/RPN11